MESKTSSSESKTSSLESKTSSLKSKTPWATSSEKSCISERVFENQETLVKEKAYREIQESRGYNTSTSYCAKQVEFLIFCDQYYARHPLAKRHQATSNKLLSFLYQKVINRQLRKPGTKHIEESNIDNNEGLDEETIKTNAIQKKLSYSTCNAYVSAIVDLWNYQRLMCFNSTESPRTKVITKLLKVVQMREANNNWENNVDRATTSISNGYTTNLQVPKVGAEGAYPIMMMIFNQAKTNKFNKTQTGACMHNKMVEICPFMALSFHFFWRWHCQKETFPNMENNGNWFQLKAFHGARPQSRSSEKKGKGKGPERIGADSMVVGNDDSEELSDDEICEAGNQNPLETVISKGTHTRFMKIALNSAGIFVTRKVTHVPRSSAAKMADLASVPESQIQRMGQWNTDMMTNSYLDSLPRQFMRVMAGFENDASYHLLRGIEEPCSDLKRMKHELFKTQLFLDFQSKVKSHITSNTETESSILGRFAPEVELQLSSINQILREFNERQRQSDQAQRQLQQAFNNVISGKQQLQLSVRLNNDNQATETTGTVASSPHTNINNTSTNVTSPPQPPQHPSEITSPLVNEVPVISPTPNTTANATISLPYTNEGIPVYKMSRQVATVTDFWDEWMVGRDGFWSIEELESKSHDRKWFNIRKKIIDAVNDLQKDLGLSSSSAISVLQGVMNARHWSLDRLGTELQKGTYFPSPETKRRKLGLS
ncbi:hypothetical protein INT45_013619 [Circinella minor]|uniref:Ndc10 domain-containing protein n=1 Tax=Circinella minor TaxID=1195481 RepID=A0A8H7RST0_9FUNG|nr:hypothetical protein INT45_013619 [Circinella minor]